MGFCLSSTTTKIPFDSKNDDWFQPSPRSQPAEQIVALGAVMSIAASSPQSASCDCWNAEVL